MPKKAEIGRTFIDAGGYVRIRTAEGWEYEHRAVWRDHFGPIPAGLHVHHLNHVRDDNRPENLALVTKSEHMRHHAFDMHATGVIQNRGSASVRYRIDLDMSDAEITRLRDAEGLSFREIGRRLGGVSHNVVSNHYRRYKESTAA